MATTPKPKRHKPFKPGNFTVIGPELPKWPPGPPTVPIEAHDPTLQPARYAIRNPSPSLASAEECRVFVSLYSAHREFVVRTVERHGVPARDADDVTQEVFAVALSRIRDYDAAREARPWLFVIAIQRASNYCRLARHRVEPLSPTPPSEPPSPATDVESSVIACEERSLVHELIGRLSPKLREILVMHDLEEMPMNDILAALNIPLKTAQSRLKLARDEVLRRGQSLALAQNAVPLRNRDMIRVREELLSYRPSPPVPMHPGTMPQRRGPSKALNYCVFA